MPGQKDERTDRPYFIGTFRIPPGVQFVLDFDQLLQLTNIFIYSNINKYEFEECT